MDCLADISEFLRSWANGEKWVEKVYLFGSRVWGNPMPHSDLDILVVTPPGYGFDDQLGIWTKKIQPEIDFTVDVSSNFQMCERTLDRIEREGVLVFPFGGRRKIRRDKDTIIDID